MKQIIIDTRITNGYLKLHDIPLENDTEVRVIVIPKVNLSKMSLQNSQCLTKPVKGNLSDDIISERSEK